MKSSEKCFNLLRIAMGNVESLLFVPTDRDWRVFMVSVKGRRCLVLALVWSRNSMGKFPAAVMWVLHEVFAMPAHYYICEPNEKEGRKLLAEVMQGGNFGQYDERGKEMRNGGTVSHAIWKLKRVMRLVSSYPEEALCEPFFRVWHWGRRVLH